jgi:TATA-box binding protein (TBP) (component of TFIID and TFIIIB)
MISSNDSKNDVLDFPKFEDIKVSTKTFILMTNFKIKIKELFDFLPITEYIVIPKRRGRKKKSDKIDPNKDIESGSIITLELGEDIRGVDLKKKKNSKKKKRGSYFRNAVTVVMFISNKKINFKISCNGHFQVTGCKNTTHAAICIKYIWSYIKDTQHIYEINDSIPSVTFIPAMRNIDFSLGFTIDREKLDEYINTQTEYTSLLETSFGYTGVNIKLKVYNKITDLNLKQMKYIDEEWIEEFTTPYQTYLDILKPKEQEKKLKKERHNTFLIFHSGKAIMSGINSDFQRRSYYEFLDIIRKCYGIIKENLYDSNSNYTKSHT